MFKLSWRLQTFWVCFMRFLHALRLVEMTGGKNGEMTSERRNRALDCDYARNDKRALRALRLGGMIKKISLGMTSAQAQVFETENGEVRTA